MDMGRDEQIAHEIEEIGAVLAKVHTLVALGEFEEVQTYYSDDMVMVNPVDGVIQGKEANIECAKARPSGVDTTFNIERKEVCGKFGFIIASFKYLHDGVEGKGHFCTIFNKQEDGSWLIKAELADFD